MKNFEIARVAERGHQLSQKMYSEYGGLIVPEGTHPETQIPRAAFLQRLQRGRMPQLSEDITLIKPQLPGNLAHLTSPAAIGRTFGIMTTSRIVHAGIITDRTKPGELHFTRLSGGGGVELANFRGMDDLGRMTVEVGGLIQHPSVGTAVADSRFGTAAEIGHTMQALSALTDPKIYDSLQSGTGHVVHGWAETGIAGALTNRDSGTSAFAVKTKEGEINNGFAPELIITEDTPGYVLVDHVSMSDKRESERLEVSPAELAAGLGILAAESQLEQNGVVFEDQIMRVMRAI